MTDQEIHQLVEKAIKCPDARLFESEKFTYGELFELISEGNLTNYLGDWMFSNSVRHTEIAELLVKAATCEDFKVIGEVNTHEKVKANDEDVTFVEYDSHARGEDMDCIIEMQLRNTVDLPRRPRMYTSTHDVKFFVRQYEEKEVKSRNGGVKTKVFSKGYNSLKKLRVIFYTKADPFGLNHPRYRFRNIDCERAYYKAHENPVELEDGVEVIFICMPAAMKNDVDVLLRDVCSTLMTGEINMNTEAFDRVRRLMSATFGQKEVLDLIEQAKSKSVQYMEEYNAALLAEERAEKDSYIDISVKSIMYMLTSGMPIDEIAKIIECPIDKIKEIITTNTEAFENSGLDVDALLANFS